jgi:microsomal dipeptidase-like Zn-dependent dipeptidase
VTPRRRAPIRSRRRLATLALAGLAAALAASACSIEGWINRTLGDAPAPASERARALHRASFVVDLHADSLLWSRDLLARSSVGHVDLPRLREGGVALQMFTIVTRVPRSVDFERTDPDTADLISALAWAHGWPRAARASLLERALFQARALDQTAARSEGALRLVRWREDVARLRERRGRDPDATGALLGVEGAHALEGRVENLAPLFDAGVRMVGLAHFFDNEFAGSAHGLQKGGLTELGRALVLDMERRGVLLDLAHASPRAIDDALALVRAPPVVSHTGVQATCPGPRNLSDDQLRAIAAKGGVVGIAFFEEAVCGTAPADVARALRHVVDLLGDEHAALGSDFDGAVTTSFDASRMDAITQALLDTGLSEASVRRILGENALRLLERVLLDAPAGR